MKYLINSLTIFFLLFTLTSCGFQLRDASLLPTQLHTLHITSYLPYSTVTKQLQRNVKQPGLKISEQAPYTLHILNENFSLQTFTTANAQINQGYMFYTLTYSLTNSTGKNLLGPTAIVVSNTITTDANQMSGTSNEQAVVRNEMIQEAIGQLLNQLAAHQTHLLLQHQPS